MSFDFLKPILGDELYAQFCDKMSGAQGINLVNVADGSYIPKAKFDDEHTKVKNLNQQLTDVNAKLAAAQQQNGDTASLNDRITQLTADLAARDSQLSEQKLAYMAMDALRDRRARNPKAVLSMLDMSKVTEKDGKLDGLDDQLDALQKSDGYMFENAPGANGGFGGNSGSNFGNLNPNQQINDAIRSASGRNV